MSDWLEVVEPTSGKLADQPIDPLHAQFTCEHEWGRKQLLYSRQELAIRCKNCGLIMTAAVDADDRIVPDSERTVWHGETL